MKKFHAIIIALGLMLYAPAQGHAVNTKTTVTQVTTTVSVSDDVDYIISGETPFGTDGIVNITNTDHAVLILESVKPSKALDLLASHVQINGAKAINNNNCQVKLYNRGCIIMPYPYTIKPLTVYSEQNFQGTSCNNFGLENSGGFMNTLTEEKLNNQIRSFKLKRGYMVTFSLRAKGRGYSRCFIADDEDLEIATLPSILDQSISSYRIFKWYDTGKQALANDTQASSVNALNVTSCYSFGLGQDLGIDCECVPHHIYEDWPSASACGSVTYSPHMKTNNEPGNSSDDHPQSVETILNNWENLMATGMRLCSPSSHDGSLNHLRQFMDSIDARGWRCDIIDLHCYWAEGSFSESNIKSQWVDRYHRPIWISEWVWGASWNSNGAFASGVTEAQNAAAVERICTKLNNWDYIERYYYWNSERDPSRILKNGSLTQAGKYYASINSGVGYNGKYDYVPNIPKQYAPGNLTISYDKTTKVATLKFYEYNGEMNQSFTIEQRKTSNSSWEKVCDVKAEESPSEYNCEIQDAVTGCEYRVHVIDANKKEYYTNIVMAASEDLTTGDVIYVDGTAKYLGGNIIANSSFDMGFYGWTNGLGTILAEPSFQVVPVGGIDGGTYLQSYGNGGKDTETAIKTVFDIKPQTNYLFAGSICNSSGYFCQLNLSSDGNATDAVAASLSNTTANWMMKQSTFNSGDYSKAIVYFRSLGCQTQIDNMFFAQLFDTEADAIKDGVEKAILKAEAFKGYNTKYTYLNDELTTIVGSDQSFTSDRLNLLEAAIAKAIEAYNDLEQLAAEESVNTGLVNLKLYGYNQLEQAIQAVGNAQTAEAVTDAFSSLNEIKASYLPLDDAASQPTQPNLVSATGWTTKCGTYTGGDQRINSRDGVTFWNAWWSGLSASEGTNKTMEIKQDITGLSHGLYALECKATTEHFCVSDQHGYIVSGETTGISPYLTTDYFDLPTVAVDDCWQTLTTAPVYVPDDSTVTIGFVGSKAGATDYAWHKIGSTAICDKREGWWCATDFVLKYHPLYKTTVVPEQFGVICLPYAIHASEAVKLYQIVGISQDYTKLCIEEIEGVEAGMSCIYRSSTADVDFLEYGTAAKRTTDAPGNIRGFYTTSAKVPVGYYYLENGVWNKVTDAQNRPSISKYSGIIRPFTDALSKGIPVLQEWSGETMPINGVTEEEKEYNTQGIAIPLFENRPDGYYSIDGRRVEGNNNRSGLYIRVENGRAKKMIIK